MGDYRHYLVDAYNLNGVTKHETSELEVLAQTLQDRFEIHSSSTVVSQPPTLFVATSPTSTSNTDFSAMVSSCITTTANILSTTTTLSTLTAHSSYINPFSIIYNSN